MPYRANPFFSTTSTFFLPSVGDKVDQAIDKTKAKAYELEAQGKNLLNQAENKVDGAKSAVKNAAKPSPTGVDLYARCVVRRQQQQQR